MCWKHKVYLIISIKQIIQSILIFKKILNFLKKFIPSLTLDWSLFWFCEFSEHEKLNKCELFNILNEISPYTFKMNKHKLSKTVLEMKFMKKTKIQQEKVKQIEWKILWSFK